MSSGDATDKFTGLTGIWKQWASLGAVALLSCLAVYAVVVAMPRMQEAFHDELRIERDAARTDIQKSREHGNTAAKELADAIREQTKVLSDHQTKVRENQLKILEAQLKMAPKDEPCSEQEVPFLTHRPAKTDTERNVLAKMKQAPSVITVEVCELNIAVLNGGITSVKLPGLDKAIDLGASRYYDDRGTRGFVWPDGSTFIVLTADNGPSGQICHKGRAWVITWHSGVCVVWESANAKE